MKIFSCETIREIDDYTIKNEPITSINLMERAASALFNELKKRYANRPFLILAGPGNNGGDALAIARMMLIEKFDITLIMLQLNALSPDTLVNMERFKQIKNSKIIVWEENSQLPEISENCVILDGLFGSGLNRPISGKALDLVQKINKLSNLKVSIDIPSGLMGENNSSNNSSGIIKANNTYSFQFPKLSFLFPENQQYVGKWEVLDIGLHKKKITETSTNWYITESHEVASMILPRGKFSHKGTYGHALLIAGSYGKMGAAILASKGCLRSGAGLLTVHVPKNSQGIIHTAIPEAMVEIDSSEQKFTELCDLSAYSAIGIGPGIGTCSEVENAFAILLENIKEQRVVIDADAINLISKNKKLLEKLPPKSILTPHTKEFERLCGTWNNDFQRLEKAIDFCIKHEVILVLKGAYTTIILPDGTCKFNPTGNPGMATAGSGDVLTGIILGLVTRGLSPENAAIAGVYLHGLAGDIAKNMVGEESLISSYIITCLGQAFMQIC